MILEYKLDKFFLSEKTFSKHNNAIKQAFMAAFIEGQGYVAEEHLSAPGRAPEPAWPISQHRLRTDTGRLRQSWLSNTPRMSGSGDRLKISLTTRVNYAEYHEREGQRQPFSYGMKQAGKLMAETLQKVYLSKVKDLS